MIVHSAEVWRAFVELDRPSREPWDLTVGCGVAVRPEGFGEVATGRVCAGTGAALSCQLCPHSPTYWRNVR